MKPTDGDNKFCSDSDSTQNLPIFDLAVFAVVLLCFWFVLYKFVVGFRTIENNGKALKMNRSVKLYLCVASVYVHCGFYWFVLERFRQRFHGTQMWWCQLCTIVLWMLAVCFYMALENVLLTRLEVAFSGSFLELSDAVVFKWRCYFAFVIAFSLGFCILRATYTDCWVRLKGSPYQTQASVFGRDTLGCRGTGTYWTVNTLYVAFGGLTLLASSGVLARMYYTRARRVFFPDRHKTGASLKSEALKADNIRKSTVIACVSILSTMVILILVAAVNWHLFAYAELVLQSALICCLFRFGDHWYQKLLFPLSRLVNKFMPERIKQVDVEFRQSQVGKLQLTKPRVVASRTRGESAFPLQKLTPTVTPTPAQ